MSGYAPEKLSLKDRMSFFFKDVVIYGGASAIGKAMTLVTFPLLARYFSVPEFGVIDYVTGLVSILTIFMIFGQDSAVARYYYEYEDTDSRRQVISLSLLWQAIMLAVMLPVLWQFTDRLDLGQTDTVDSETVAKLALLQVPFLLVINFSQNILKYTFSRSRFLFISVGYTVVYSLVLLLLVLSKTATVAGVVAATLGVAALFAVLGLFFVRQWLTVPRQFRLLKEIVPYAIPYGIVCYIGAVLPVVERTTANYFFGATELGLYAAGAKIALIVRMLTSAFHMAWGPFSLAMHKHEDAAVTYNLVLKVFVVFISAFVLMLSAVSYPLLVWLASDRYAAGALMVFPLSMAVAIEAAGWITEIGISISKRSHLNIYAYIVYILVAALFIWLFAATFGLVGIAIGVLFASIGKALASAVLAQRAFPIHWQYRDAVYVLFYSVLFGGAGLFMQATGAYWFYFLYMTAGTMVLLAWAWFIMLTAEEKHALRVLVQSKLPGAIGGRRGNNSEAGK